MSSIKKKVFVAMSGGVDSSVAAYLLKERGYDVLGVFMRCYNLDGCAEQDSEDARRVAEKLNIPFYVWDFEEEYKKRVVEYMVDGYRRGLTPNPDIMCNREIKFGLFLKKALELGAEYIATGHYAIVKPMPRFSQRTSATERAWSPTLGRRSEGAAVCERTRWASERREKISASVCYQLFEAKDKNKDQSYFLWTLTQEQLKHCLFPIGDYLKPEVREIARQAGLPTAEKKDSQGICFLGKVTLRDFLKDYIPEKAGAVVTVSGEKIGEHRGAQFYTNGQRHIGVANSRPLYVAEKDIENNTLVVAEGDDNPALYKKEIELTDVNFLRPDIISLIRANGSIKVLARVRYRQPLAEARIMYHESCIKLIFDKSQKFVAPGQSAVFYSKESELLGGGVIV